MVFHAPKFLVVLVLLAGCSASPPAEPFNPGFDSINGLGLFTNEENATIRVVESFDLVSWEDVGLVVEAPGWRVNLNGPPRTGYELSSGEIFIAGQLGRAEIVVGDTLNFCGPDPGEGMTTFKVKDMREGRRATFTNVFLGGGTC